MERKQEVVRRLRVLEELRQTVQNMDAAMQVLTPEERLVVQLMFICPEERAAQKLCGLLHVERSAVYRKRDRALRKLTAVLGVGSEGSAAGGGRSDPSEWQRSADTKEHRRRR